MSPRVDFSPRCNGRRLKRDPTIRSSRDTTEITGELAEVFKTNQVEVGFSFRH